MSNAEYFWLGGILSTPRVIGVTVLLDERTVILAGEPISVIDNTSVVEWNSATTPPSETKSPRLTLARLVFEDVKMLIAFETRISLLGGPCIQNPEVPFAVTMPFRPNNR